jgi:hypothetical protein
MRNMAFVRNNHQTQESLVGSKGETSIAERRFLDCVALCRTGARLSARTARSIIARHRLNFGSIMPSRIMRSLAPLLLVVYSVLLSLAQVLPEP